MNLSAKPYRNLDDSANVGIARFFDAGKDDAMNNIRRPGLGGPVSDHFADLGTGKPVDTLYEWEYQGFSVAISDGRIFKVTQSGVVTEITGATVTAGFEASFADFGTTLYLAARSRIVKWTATDATCAFVADTDAPTNVTHLGFVDQYLIALEYGTSRVWFAEVNAPDDWQGELFTAESLKDKAKALHVANREVTLFGTKTIEYWGSTSDPNAPFQRFEGTQTDHGTIAPYSVVFADNTFFFLDHLRNVVRLQGRNPVMVSNPFDTQIKAMDVVEDARAMHFPHDTLYVLTFPTEDKTFAYDYKRDVWSEWTFFNNETGDREAFLGLSACYMRAWNKTLVGSRKDGKIYFVSNEYASDGGSPMVFELWTGWNGNGEWTFVSELLTKLRRGDGPDSDPVLELFYRDRNASAGPVDSAWKGPRHILLGQLGESDHHWRERRLGRYRNRQYRFRCASDVPIVLIGAVEK